MPSVLFVCTANVCRSPMASALFQKILAQRSDTAEWRVASAGVWALEDSPAVGGAQAVMAARGLDLSQHRARSITSQMVNHFDLILTMERSHKEALRAEFPRQASRIYLLSEMVGRSHDIRDPVGGTPADYEDTARELEQILTQGLEQIEQAARARN